MAETTEANAVTAPWMSRFFEARDRFRTSTTAGLIPLVHRRYLREGRRVTDRVYAYDHDGRHVRTAESVERVCHLTRVPAFVLPLRAPHRQTLVDELHVPRLERAIGVVYRPHAELESHYFPAVLSSQFDEYVWFDESSAVRMLEPEAWHPGRSTDAGNAR